jgi:hypothetical protein
MIRVLLFVMYTGHKLPAHDVHHLRYKCSTKQFRQLEFTGQFSTEFRIVPEKTHQPNTTL